MSNQKSKDETVVWFAGKCPWGRVWEIREKKDTPDLVLAWFDTIDERGWIDLLTSASHGIPTVMAGAGFLSRDPPINTVRLHECRDIGTAVFVAREMFAHGALGSVLATENLREALRLSGSPIETRLLLHLWPLAASPNTTCRIIPQLTIGRFRVDFAISNEALDTEADPIRIVVECDGHDFHERTKEQAAADKSRDREFTLAGWTVLRFTGSEIWRDAAKCADQVHDIIASKGGSF